MFPSHQVVFGLGHVGVVRAQFGLVDLQGSPVVIFHLLILALILTEQSQVVELLGDIRMIRSKHFFSDLKRTLT